MSAASLDDPFAERLRRRLAGATGAPVAVRQTHVSWVFLTDDRAYKLKKPVRLAFVDQSTPARRRALCEQELAANQVLAPGIVLGVRGVLPDDERSPLTDADDPRAVDWVVEMRRFDEAHTMAARLAAGTLTPRQIDAVGQALAAFHAGAGASAGQAEHAASVLELCTRNLTELETVFAGKHARGRLDVARRFAAAFVASRADALARRAADGLVVDGHGDLRAEHVLLEDHAVTFVDRLEFDRELRIVDVADDLAFLVMDLASLDGRAAGERLVAAYRAAGGDPGDDALIAFFAAYRAQVRAKVALLRGDARRGEALLSLAERFTWQARGPQLLLVTGPPASGKSTLAHALAAASGLPVLSSDAVRKRTLGLALDQAAPVGAYTGPQRAQVYRAIAAEAAGQAARGGAIIDATFGDEQLQQAFFGALPAAAAGVVRVIECRVPAGELVRRAALRTPAEAAGSDAGAGTARRLAASFHPVERAGVPRLVVDVDASPQELVGRVTRWLDQQLGTDAGAAARG